MLRQHVYYAITFVPGQFVPDVWNIKADGSIVNYDEISIIDSHGWEVSENQWHRNTLFQVLNFNEFELNTDSQVKSNLQGATEFSSEDLDMSEIVNSPRFGSTEFNRFNIDLANSITVLKFELQSVIFDIDTLDSSKIIEKVPVLAFVSPVGSLDRSNKIESLPVHSVIYNKSKFSNSFLNSTALRTISFNNYTLGLTDGSNLTSVTAHTYISEESTTSSNMNLSSFVSWKHVNTNIKASAADTEFVSWFAKAGTTNTALYVPNLISWFAKAGTTNPSFKKETTTIIQSFEGSSPEQSSIRGI